MMMNPNLGAVAAAMTGQATAAPAAAPPPAEPSFFKMLADLKGKDPLEVLTDPESTGMEKFLAVLMSSKIAAQSNGSGFAFSGPNSNYDPETAKLMKALGARAKPPPTQAAGGLPVTDVGGKPGGLASLLRPRSAFA